MKLLKCIELVLNRYFIVIWRTSGIQTCFSCLSQFDFFIQISQHYNNYQCFISLKKFQTLYFEGVNFLYSHNFCMWHMLKILWKIFRQCKVIWWLIVSDSEVKRIKSWICPGSAVSVDSSLWAPKTLGIDSIEQRVPALII